MAKTRSRTATKVKSKTRGKARKQALQKKQLGMGLLQANQPAEALALYAEAARLDDSDADTWYVLGAIHGMLGQPAEAVTATRRSLTLRPGHAEAHNNLGIALEKLGQLEQATASYQQAVRLKPDDVEARKNLGSALNALGHAGQALEHYRHALQRQPGHPGLHNDLGNALLALHHYEEAETHYRQALALNPGYTRACSHLGAALRGQSRLAEAIDCGRQAIAMQPADAVAHHNLAESLQAAGQAAEALEHYQQALRLDPGFVEAYNHLGTLLQRLGRHDEAEQAYRQALQARPDYAEAHVNLGNLYHELGRHSEAQTAYRQALHYQPTLAAAWNNLGTSALQAGRYDQALDAYAEALRIRPDYPAARSSRLLAMNYDPALSPQDLSAAHRAWGEHHRGTGVAAGSVPPSIRPGTGQRRLRIGYVSPDLRTHSVAYFIEPVLRHHDPEQFEVFCYAEVAAPDATTRRLQQWVPHWRNSCGLSDEQLRAQIRADGIDILVDLAGHTSGNRLGVFAPRSAALQVTYLGYPNTTGLDTIDARITDALADPPDQDALYSERLVRLADGFLCFAAPADAPAVTPPPCLDKGHVTFASFNNLAKVNPQVVASWAAILHAVDHSRLLLKSRALRDADVAAAYQAQFREHGIAPERIELVGWTAHTVSHLAQYAGVDIALDTFPYNGTTTTCEAMWMGVPVISLRGNRHAGRVGLSLLERVGLEDLCAPDTQMYIDTAVRLAGDPATLAQWRGQLRERSASALGDAPRFTRELEAAYRTLWQELA